MAEYVIRGVTVRFPFEAYQCQRDFMAKVIEAVQTGQNALLESPTGTGKTVSLLCSVLAWRASEVQRAAFSLGSAARATGAEEFASGEAPPGGGIPRIIYASRTHSQLAQVVKELKLTKYRESMVVMGSRQQLCVHPRVRRLAGEEQTRSCRMHVMQRQCGFYHKVESVAKLDPIGDNPVDIEDLARVIQQHRACPYYYSRQRSQTANLVLLPYNYLLSPQVRSDLDLTNSIVIFDEAHNLPSACGDTASFDLSPAQLAGCIAEVTQCLDLLARKDAEAKFRDVLQLATSTTQDHIQGFGLLKTILLRLEALIASVGQDGQDKITGEQGSTGAANKYAQALERGDIPSERRSWTQPGRLVFALLNRVHINPASIGEIQATMRRCIDMLLASDAEEGAGVGAGIRRKQCYLEHLQGFLQVV